MLGGGLPSNALLALAAVERGKRHQFKSFPVGYSYKVKDTEGSVKRRRYKPHELLVVENVASSMNTDRLKRDEKGANKYKTVNKLIRNEDMTRTEARKDVKGMEANVLGPARNTRSQTKMTRSQTRK